MAERFTQDQYERAANASLVRYLMSNGYTLIREGSNYHVKLPSVNGYEPHIDVKENRYIDRKTGGGGYALKFVQEYEGKTVVQAVLALCGYSSQATCRAEESAADDKTLILPPKNDNHRRVYAYLVNARHIDRNIVLHQFHQHNLYESSDFKNAVFISRDKDGEPRSAFIRSTQSNPEYSSYKANARGSDKSYPYTIRGDEKLAGLVCVFESPIDLMSYMTLKNSQGYGDDLACSHYIALCGVDARGLNRFLDENPHIRRINLCLDNDVAGITAMDSLTRIYSGKGYEVSRELSWYKDWNEELCRMVCERQEEERLNDEREEMAI